jgi:hypothetical protein
MPVQTMSIVYCKQMEASCVKHVGNEDITVLVHFVGVSRLISTRCGESEFGNSVKPVVYFWLVDLNMRFWFFDFLF